MDGNVTYLQSLRDQIMFEGECSEPTTHRSTGSLIDVFILFPAGVATETIEAVASYLEIGCMLVDTMS